MENINTRCELSFHPIRFTEIGTNGKVGENGPNQNYFKTALPQNIVYLARRSAKTVNEMADTLGVSPVYVESEAELLERYGFFDKPGRPLPVRHFTG